MRIKQAKLIANAHKHNLLNSFCNNGCVYVKHENNQKSVLSLYPVARDASECEPCCVYHSDTKGTANCNAKPKARALGTFHWTGSGDREPSESVTWSFTPSESITWSFTRSPGLLRPASLRKTVRPVVHRVSGVHAYGKTVRPVVHRVSGVHAYGKSQTCTSQGFSSACLRENSQTCSSQGFSSACLRENSQTCTSQGFSSACLREKSDLYFTGFQ